MSNFVLSRYFCWTLSKTISSTVVYRYSYNLFFRLDAVQTEDELGDVYTHFMLYYGRDLVAMKNKKASASKIPTEEDVEEEQVEDIKKEGASMKQARRYMYMYVQCFTKEI